MLSAVSIGSVLQVPLNTYWICAILSILAKRFLSWAETALNYGKLGSQCKPQSRPFLIFRPSFAWSLFYLCGAIFTIICAMIQFPPSLSLPSDLHFDSFCLILFLIQTVRRFFECLLVHKHSSSYTITPLQLISGVSFYIASPLSLMCDALLGTSTVSPHMKFIQSKFIVSSC